MDNLRIFKADEEILKYVCENSVRKIGFGTEGYVNLTKQHDTIKYIEKRHRVLYTSSILMKSDLDLDSFLFPTELILNGSRIAGYRTDYFPNNLFSKDDVEIDLDKLLEARDRMIEDIKVLSKRNYSIRDLKFNLMYDGERFAAIDTLDYTKTGALSLSDNIYNLDNAIRYNLNYICPMTVFMNHLPIEKMAKKVETVTGHKVITYKKVV